MRHIFLSLCLTLFFLQPAAAQDTQFSAPRTTDELARITAELSDEATRAARRAGQSAMGSIACDAFGIRCTCDGIFHCAWLAYGCSVAGGVSGFDGECFFPRMDDDARPALTKFILAQRIPGQAAHCEGPECFCSGGADSDDCNKIAACIDDIQCVGDSCGCWGGHVE